MNTIAKELQALGLDDNAAAVYAALLELGPTTALKVSRYTAIKRPTVYYTLSVLEKRGLAYQEVHGLKRLFAPAHPDQFDVLIADQKRKFDVVLPKLTQLYHMRGTDNHVKYFEGVHAAVQMHELTLKELRSGDPYYVIAHNPNWDTLAPGWIDDFVARRAKRNVDTRILYPDSPFARRAKELGSVYKQHVKVVKEMPTQSVIVICPERYVTHNFESPIRGVSIENKDIIETQLAMFRMLWDSLPE